MLKSLLTSVLNYLKNNYTNCPRWATTAIPKRDCISRSAFVLMATPFPSSFMAWLNDLEVCAYAREQL